MMSIENAFEFCVIKLFNYKIEIIFIYILYPAGRINVFFIELEQLLTNVSKGEHQHVILAGVINIDVLKSNNVTANEVKNSDLLGKHCS